MREGEGRGERGREEEGREGERKRGEGGRGGGIREQPNIVYSLRAYVSKYTNAAFVSVLRERQ